LTMQARTATLRIQSAECAAMAAKKVNAKGIDSMPFR